MGIVEQVQSGGWGAILLWMLASGYLLFNQQQRSAWALLVIAAFPALIVMFLVRVFNWRLVDFWAGGNLKRAGVKIQQITGNQDFYESAPPEVQQRVDELDDKAYGINIEIFSGILFGLIFPVGGFVEYGLFGFLGGLVAGIASVYLLGTRAVRELNREASQLATVYQSKYENQ